VIAKPTKFADAPQVARRRPATPALPGLSRIGERLWSIFALASQPFRYSVREVVRIFNGMHCLQLARMMRDYCRI
jgi:hypothetical protein